VTPRPSDPWDLPFPYFTPSAPPQTLPQPQPVRRTLPRTPGIPQKIPTPAPVPTIIPDPARTPRPVPAAIPMLPNFLPAPAPVSPVVQVPAGVEVPWAGAEPVGQEAKAPPPTMTGIASELGRIEQKLAQIGAQGPGFDLPGLIEAIANLINNQPDYNYPAGSYLMEPVCDYDANGDPAPAREVSWPAGVGELAEIRERLDAIAELFQVSKELRQPVCRGGNSGGPSPQGQPVTVTFEEEPA